MPTPDPTEGAKAEPSPPRPAPDGLAVRGARLWERLVPTVTDEARAVLLEEACRAADRLDRLDGILRGKGEVYERLALDGTTVILIVDQVLAEARQQASALRLLVGALPIPKVVDKEPPDGDEDGDPDAWMGMSAEVLDTTEP